MRLFPILVAALATAGCMGAADTPTTVSEASLPATTDGALTPPSAGGAPDAPAEVPVWAAGDAWEIESFNDGEDGERATLVVTSVDAAGYTLASTSERTATMDAAFDMSYIGKLRATDLAGSQRDTPVTFFAFPMTDGKAWTTTWDRQTIALTAKFDAALSTPLGPQPGFRIVGVDESGKDYVHYDFVPAMRWWTHLEFTEGYGFKVTGVKQNWTGEYASATAKPLLTLTTAAPVASTPAGTFTVGEGATSIFMTLTGRAGPYARGLVIVDPTGKSMPVENYESSPDATRFFETESFAAVPGEWKVIAPTVHDQAGSLTLSFTQITVAKQALVRS